MLPIMKSLYSKTTTIAPTCLKHLSAFYWELIFIVFLIGRGPLHSDMAVSHITWWQDLFGVSQLRSHRAPRFRVHSTKPWISVLVRSVSTSLSILARKFLTAVWLSILTRMKGGATSTKALSVIIKDPRTDNESDCGRLNAHRPAGHKLWSRQKWVNTSSWTCKTN